MNILEKWKPILDLLLKYHESKDTPKLRQFLTEYAEHHSNIENKILNTFQTSFQTSTLPISLKLLSMLNLDNIELNIIKTTTPKFKINNNGVGFILENSKKLDYDNYEITISLTRDQIYEFNLVGVDILQKVEHLLLEENAKEINKKLETSKELNVYMMVNNINMSDIINHGNGIKEKLTVPIISISNMIQIN